MRLVKLTLVLYAGGFLAACTPSISEQSKANLAKQVNCATAKKDIASLEKEKTSVATQVTAGVRSVVPAAAIAGLLRGDTKDRAKVASGAYNKEIDAKITEIKKACGLE